MAIPHISARRADAATFWTPNPDVAPVQNEIVKALMSQHGLQEDRLPTALRAIYAVQNGGAVRFRHTPPQFVNPHGYTNYNPAAQNWLDAFPDGLLPMEDWQRFDDWRKKHGLAMEQSPYDFAERIDEPDNESATETKLNLFVIGDHTSAEVRMITLLDLSTGTFNRNGHLMTLRFNSALDTFEFVFGPILADNVYSGLFQTVKARKSEL